MHETYRAQVRVKEFEKDHQDHPLSTTSLSELIGYANVNSRYENKKEKYDIENEKQNIIIEH
jgi:hypothetical protein